VLACAEPEPVPSLVLIWIEAGVQCRRACEAPVPKLGWPTREAAFLEAGLGRRGLLITG